MYGIQYSLSRFVIAKLLNGKPILTSTPTSNARGGARNLPRITMRYPGPCLAAILVSCDYMLPVEKCSRSPLSMLDRFISIWKTSKMKQKLPKKERRLTVSSRPWRLLNSASTFRRCYRILLPVWKCSQSPLSLLDLLVGSLADAGSFTVGPK